LMQELTSGRHKLDPRDCDEPRRSFVLGTPQGFKVNAYLRPSQYTTSVPVLASESWIGDKLRWRKLNLQSQVYLFQAKKRG